MTPSTFRETVAVVAEKARAILPAAVNGRIEAAVKLVLAHDVTVLADGRIEVGSSSDPMKVYHLVGTTCTCPDFTQGRAPGGWCKHRIAAGIAKRVRELLPVAAAVPVAPDALEPWPDNDPELEPELEPWPDNDPELEPELESEPELEPEPAAAPVPVPEMPFSLTLKGTMDGHDALLTARGMTPDEFRRNLQAIRGLLDAPAQTPRPPISPPDTPAAPAAGPPPEGWCAIHQVHMTLYPAKDGGKGWWSHKTEGGRWCKGK